MTRLAMLIVLSAAVGVGMVHLRRAEIRVRYETQRELGRQTALRRTLWRQRAQIGQLLAPTNVHRRADEMALDLTGDREARVSLGEPVPGEPPTR